MAKRTTKKVIPEQKPQPTSDLDSSTVQLPDRMWRTVEFRALEWEALEKDGAIGNGALDHVLKECQIVFTGVEGIHDVAGMFYDIFLLAENSRRFTDADWSNPWLRRYLKFMRYDFAVLLRSLSNACESFGISSEPLAAMALTWVGHTRMNPDPKEALLKFFDAFEPEVTVQRINATAQRLLRKTETTLIANQINSGGRKQYVVQNGTLREVVPPPASKKSQPSKVADATKRRRKLTPPKDFIYLRDAHDRTGVPLQTLHKLASDPKHKLERKKDEEANEVRVRESVLFDLLKKKGLPRT